MKLHFLKSGITPLGWFVKVFERGGDYSHVELEFSDGMCFSCVADEGFKDFGVRKKRLNIDDSLLDWATILLPFVTPVKELHMRDYSEGMNGKPYDILSLLGYVFKAGRMMPNTYICSEFVADVLAYGGLWTDSQKMLLSPSGLYKMVTTQPYTATILTP